MWKKLLCATLVAAMMLSTLAFSALANDEPKKDVTLTIWQVATDETPYEIERRATFQTLFPYIHLNVVQAPQDSELLSALAAGNAPSVYICGYPAFKSYIYQGAFLNLDAYVADTPDYQNFDPVQVQAFSANGSVYGVPGGKYALCLAYNKRHFEAAGITEVPKTWDAFLDACVKLTVPEKQQYGMALNIAQWPGWQIEPWVWSAGGDMSIENPDGTMALTFTDPAVVAACEFYRKLIEAKVIQPDRNMQIADLNTDFAQGKAAMVICDIGKTRDFEAMGMKPEDIGFMSFPAGASGKGYNLDGGDGMGIVYTTDKDVADAAWQYVMFMHSLESFTALYEGYVAKGTWSPTIPTRIDIDMSQFGDIDPEILKAVEEGSKITHSEYYGKGATGSYLDDAVAIICGDLSTDIPKVLQEYQDKAAQAVADFNAAITK